MSPPCRAARRSRSGARTTARRTASPTPSATSGRNAFEPAVASEDNGNAVAVWSISDGVLQVQSSSRLDVPGYARPAAGAQFRVPLAIAFQQCGDNETPNRTHGPTLSYA